jgi:hypothetical protein
MGSKMTSEVSCVAEFTADRGQALYRRLKKRTKCPLHMLETSFQKLPCCIKAPLEKSFKDVKHVMPILGAPYSAKNRCRDKLR